MMSELPSSTMDALVAQHHASVLRVCRSILHDEHLGLDAAQETFVKLWQALGRGPAPKNLAAWLRRVAALTALDKARRHAVRARIESEPREPAQSASVTEQVSLSELKARLEATLELLPEGQRTVFRLRHEGGLRLPEVAALLGVSLSTARTHFARACLKLQERLRPFETDAGGPE